MTLADRAARQSAVTTPNPVAPPTPIEAKLGRAPSTVFDSGETVLARPQAPWLWRHYKGLLFWLFVVFPTAAGAIYYTLMASPQYITEFDVGIRMADPTALASSGSSGGQSMGGASLSGGSQLGATIIGLESYVVTQFVSSRPFADYLEEKFDVRKRFSSNAIDYWSRLAKDAPEERFAEYWSNMISAYFDLTTGAILVKVRAFSPQDSLDIANAVIEAAQARISEMREQARKDELRGAEGDVAKAEARVIETRQALSEMRDKEGIFDPVQRVTAVSTAGDTLRSDIAQMEAAERSYSKTLASDAPTIMILQKRIEAEKAQLKQLDASIATTANSTKGEELSAVVHRFNEAQAQETFAETAYQNALSALDLARTTADRQQLFLVNYIKPSKPQISLYPNRALSIATIAAFSFIAWFITILVVASLREHTI